MPTVIGYHDVKDTETAALARDTNPRVTVAVYTGLTTESREQLGAKLAASGFGA
jgi:hypothetical protein